MGENKNHVVYVDGEVLESIPPKRLMLTWPDSADTKNTSRVTLKIEPIEDMVRLGIIHEGFNLQSTMKDEISSGWPLVLSSMKSFLETGKSSINVWAKISDSN